MSGLAKRSGGKSSAILAKSLKRARESTNKHLEGTRDYPLAVSTATRLRQRAGIVGISNKEVNVELAEIYYELVHEIVKNSNLARKHRRRKTLVREDGFYAFDVMGWPVLNDGRGKTKRKKKA